MSGFSWSISAQYLWAHDLPFEQESQTATQLAAFQGQGNLRNQSAVLEYSTISLHWVQMLNPAQHATIVTQQAGHKRCHEMQAYSGCSRLVLQARPLSSKTLHDSARFSFMMGC